MSQVEAVKESANNNTSSISKKNGYHHRKKGESWNTAAAMRSLTFYNNSLTAKWNADEHIQGNKLNSRAYLLLPQDVEVIVLQTNPKHRNLSLLQIKYLLPMDLEVIVLLQTNQIKYLLPMDVEVIVLLQTNQIKYLLPMDVEVNVLQKNSFTYYKNYTHAKWNAYKQDQRKSSRDKYLLPRDVEVLLAILRNQKGRNNTNNINNKNKNNTKHTQKSNLVVDDDDSDSDSYLTYVKGTQNSKLGVTYGYNA